MRKKLKGSAMLWSICALLIVVFVLTGLLAINRSYAEVEINNIASRRADYYARSGVEVTAGMISDETLVPGGKIMDTVTQTKEAEVTYDWGTVKIERAGDEVLRLTSTATAGNMSRTVTALLKYDMVGQKWELKGYATN